jgi:hypothetical protein
MKSFYNDLPEKMCVPAITQNLAIKLNQALRLHFQLTATNQKINPFVYMCNYCNRWNDCPLEVAISYFQM